MEITFISDTHSKHYLMAQDLPGGPILVHCGDISNRGNQREVEEFLDWFQSLPYMHKIFIAGNHDFFFERELKLEREPLIEIPAGIHYLRDSHVIVEGLKFYGSPWQPWFYDWAFNLPRDGEELALRWEAIHDDTDILIVHGPPHGVLDTVARGGYSVGCSLLAKRVLEVRPKVCAFGHIHEANGQTEIDGIKYVNASMLDLRYEYTNKPTIINV